MMYWFPAQQQTTTFKRQKFGLSYLKLFYIKTKINLVFKINRKRPKIG